MAYVVSAVWTAQPGKEDVVRDAIEKLTPPSRQEPGNRFYQAFQDPAEPSVFRLFEIYDDEEAYLAHGASEHFAEYTPYFIKDGRPDLIEKFGIPLDEYPKRCVEQIERWKGQATAFKEAETIEVAESHEYASSIMNSVWTGEPSVIYGNLRNNGCITSLPENCAAEVPCLVDASGMQPTFIGDLPPQLTALIRTNINVQELTVQALMTENREHLYHAAMMDPHTAAELDLDQIWSLVDDLLTAHRD